MPDADSSHAVRRYLPSLAQAHMLVREFTLILFVLFTTVSLMIFWAELAATTDIPEESARVIGWMFDVIGVGLLAWVTLWAARLMRRSWRGEHRV